MDARQSGFSLIPYRQGTEDTSGVELLADEEKKDFERLVGSLNDIIASPEAVSKSFEGYLATIRENRLWDLELFYNRYMRFLQRHHFIPRLIKGRALTDTFNRMSCAAHREVLSEILKKEIYE